MDPVLTDTFVTPVDRVFFRKHLSVPEIDAKSWTLSVEGLVDQPLRLSLSDIEALPAQRRTVVHECFGNPFSPDVPTRAVANLEWTGVPLATLLDRAAPQASARHIWFEGADRGSFLGEDGLTFLKDLPLEAAREHTLLAYLLNGQPLPTRHGFPLRAVVPGMFGTNSVKWLSRIVLADHRPEHMFTTRLYNRVLPGSTTPIPVREIDVNSKLLSPRDGEQLPGPRVEISGRAWSLTEVTGVEVAVDDGPWEPAALHPRGSDLAWQPFSLTRTLAPGTHRIRSRATDREGRMQPGPGARNSVHEITVEVAAQGRRPPAVLLQ
ncbi:molybdopterin-dependent oxidoreductase [Streptomyces orinoci]|uniref:Molybdopterin-dependent oxidoreductase n=1 Tax=Streptomyces orinoci TaxID=67339 RepID=A0ABV3K1K2_STRON|nr:molybdopterin-dependent oxidoreductase [Streptomyces orinoci]